MSDWSTIQIIREEKSLKNGGLCAQEKKERYNKNIYFINSQSWDILHVT